MTSLRRLRTQRALAVAGLVAVAAPLMSSCGFDYATDRPNVIADGGYHIDGDVHVLAARIVSRSAGTGTFVATLTVDTGSKGATLTGISGDGITAGEFEPIEIASSSSVNLFSTGGIPVTGEFVAGDSVPMTLDFDNGSSLDVDVRVVKQCEEYADVQTLPTPGATKATGKASGKATSTPSTGASPSGSASPSATASESADDSAGDAGATSELYDCAYPSASASQAE